MTILHCTAFLFLKYSYLDPYHYDNIRKNIVSYDFGHSSNSCNIHIGDCALVMDLNTGNPYPPTAQHAIKEGSIAARNLHNDISDNMDY